MRGRKLRHWFIGAIVEEGPFAGLQPGDPIPEVDAKDIKAVWGVSREVRERHPGKQVAIGSSLYEQACQPGANVGAVWNRAAMLGLLLHTEPEFFKRWEKDGELNEVVFRAIAKVRMEWMRVGIPRKGPPFDIEEFERLLGEPQDD